MTSPYLDLPIRSHAQFIAERARPSYRIFHQAGVYSVALMIGPHVDRYVSTHATLEEARAAMPDAE